MTIKQTKLLFISTGLGTGGAEQILSTLSGQLASRNYSIVVISLLDAGFHGPDLERKGIQVITLDVPRNKDCFHQLIALIKGALTLLSEIKRVQPDLIHTWMYPADLLGGLFGRMLKVPVVWGVFSGYTTRRFYSRRSYILLRLCGLFSSILPQAVVSCSAFGRKTHIQIGYPKAKSFYIPTGFSLNSLGTEQVYVGSKDAYQSPNRPFCVGMLGRFTIEKSHDILLDAIGHLHRSSSSIHLFLAGGIGINRENSSLVELLKRYEVVNCTTLLGRVSSVEEFFKRLDVFVFVSESEGFPTVLGEAMIAGLPCIASNVGDARVLLNDPLQLISNCPTQIAERIDYFQKQPTVLAEVRRNNRARIRRLFSQEKMADRYDTLYRNLLEAKAFSQ